MQHIKKITNPEGKAADLLNAVKQSIGSTPNLFTTFANAPAALEGYLGLNGALASGKLNPQLRESIALTTAGFNGCDYCASAHTFIGGKSGLSEEELKANLRGQSSDSTTQAALNFARRILETRGHVNEADLIQIRSAGFDNEEIIEILTHVALNILTNYFNESFAVEVDFPTHVSTDSSRQAA